MSGAACTMGHTDETRSSGDTRGISRSIGMKRKSAWRPPSARRRPWYCCMGAQNGTFASSMPRFSAFRSAPLETARSRPSACTKVAKNGKSPFSWNSSVMATTGPPRRRRDALGHASR